MADFDRLNETAAGLYAAARAVSPHTLASYERRWQMWEGFALHHDLPVLPAEPEHVAAFVVARWRAGVSNSTITANLSAVLWFHRALAEDLSGVCDLARRVQACLRKQRVPDPVLQAPVVSTGALLAMGRAAEATGWTVRFSAKVLRLLSGAPPRQLAAVAARDVAFGPDGSWVEVSAPAVPSLGKHPAVPARMFRFERGLTALDCPVRAVRAVVEAGDGESLFPEGQLLYKASTRGFDPLTSPDGAPVRIGVRNRALLVVGYQGALRVEELARARVEHLTPAGDSYRPRLPEAKAAPTAHHRRSCSPPVAALDEWLAVRGDHDGPLFCTVTPGRRGHRPAGSALQAGSIRKVIRDLAVAVGLPDRVSGYSLRRSWATHQYRLDPARLPAISTQLRHSSPDMSARYIDDLGLHLLDASAFISPHTVLSGPGGVEKSRRGLGFDPAPVADLVTALATLGRPGPVQAADSSTRSLWNTWARWATDHGFDAIPATPEHLALFAAHRATSGIAARTLRAQLSTIQRVHTDAGYEAADLTALAGEIVAGLARTSPREPVSAPTLTLNELLFMAMVARSMGQRSPELTNWQDLLILTVGYAGALRPDELRAIQVQDLHPLPYGYAVHPRSSLSDRTGQAEGILLLRRTDALDPVAAIDTWLELTGTGEGPLFPVIGTRPPVPIGTQRPGFRLQRLARLGRVEVRPTGDSLKRSWAAHAQERGVDPVTLSCHLRHRDLTSTLRFILQLSPWVDNAARELISRQIAANPSLLGYGASETPR